MPEPSVSAAAPSARAADELDRLLRRVSFDLTGLPPSPQLMAQFLNDNSPGAYERAVDSLLDMPRVGLVIYLLLGLALVLQPDRPLRTR